MSCPNLDSLADALAGSRGGEIADHIGSCAACRAAVELMVLRAEASARAGCERAELLLALADDGGLGARDRAVLDAHLATCPACAALVEPAAPPVPPAVMALPSIDPAAYDLGPEIARGGMGRIRAAHDRRIGRPVVVKELLDRSPALAARFEREARVTARLQHPGIVPIYEIGTWPDGTPFYAMRRVIGRTLREALADAADLPARLALLPALVTAAEAVAFAHGRGVVHRDLTPANIVVGDYGETVVIDWGLAKELDGTVSDDAPADVRTPDTAADVTLAPDDHSLAGSIDHVAAGATASSSDRVLTRPGDILGTAAYMPPEQAAGASVDRRADVYALGALLYNLLAGATPYQGSTAEILVQLRAGAPLATTPDLEGAPRDLVSIARKAMARVPADRYADAAAFVAELRRFTAGQVVAAHQYSIGEALRRWFRKHRVLAGALIASMVAGVIALVLIARAGDQRDTERDAKVAKQRESDLRLAQLYDDRGTRSLAEGRNWHAALQLSEAYRLRTAVAAASPPVLDDDGQPQRPADAALRFELARAMRSIDAVVFRTDHRPALLPQQASLWMFPAVTFADFSPDDRHLVVSTLSGFDVLQVADGARVLSVPRPSGWDEEYNTAGGAILPWWIVRYTSTRNTLVSVDRDGRRAELWDATTGQRKTQRHADRGDWFTATDPSGRFARLFVSRDDQPTVMNLETGEIRIAPEADVWGMNPHYGSRIFDGACPASLDPRDALAGNDPWTCTRDGRSVATFVADEVTIWDTETGARRSALRADTFVRQVLFVDDDRRLLIVRDDGVELRDLASGQRLDLFMGKALALSHDRHLLAVVPDRRGIAVVRLDRPDALVRFDRAAHGLARTLAVDESGTTVLGVETNGAVRAWDLRADRAHPLPSLHEPAALAGDGRRLLAADDTEALVVVEVGSGRVVRTIATPTRGPSRRIGINRDGSRAFVVGADGTLSIAAIGSGQVRLIAGAGDSTWNAAGDRVLVCDASNHPVRYRLEPEPGAIVVDSPPWYHSSCASPTYLSEDGHAAILGGQGYVDQGDGDEGWRWEGFTDPGAVASDRRGVRWTKAEGRVVTSEMQGRNPVTFIADLPTPPRAISRTSTDPTFVSAGEATWILGGQEVGARRQLAAPARAIWYAPGDAQLVVIDTGGNVTLWDMSLEDRDPAAIAAQLRARIGLSFDDGELAEDVPPWEQVLLQLTGAHDMRTGNTF